MKFRIGDIINIGGSKVRISSIQEVKGEFYFGFTYSLDPKDIKPWVDEVKVKEPIKPKITMKPTESVAPTPSTSAPEAPNAGK